MTDGEFVPRIAAFLCWKWGYGGADMAGTIRAQQPPSMRTILVPCTGRVSTDLVIRAIGKGADATAIVAWYPGECEYDTGNYFAAGLSEYLELIFDITGIGKERVALEYCSAAEGAKFAEFSRKYTKEIQEIGPNPIFAED